MLFYHLAAFAILGFAGAGLGLIGVSLGLGVVFHSAMAVWCLACLRLSRVNKENGQ
jgi:hypothetical protein